MNPYRTFLHRTSLWNDRLWEYFLIKRQVWRRKKAIKKAERLYKATGKRYFVLPDANNKLIVLNRKEVEQLKRIGIMSGKVNFYDLMKEAVYHTK